MRFDKHSRRGDVKLNSRADDTRTGLENDGRKRAKTMVGHTKTLTNDENGLQAERDSRASTGRTLELNTFMDALANMRSVCRRRGRPLTIIQLELDRGSTQFGHTVPLDDDALSRLSRILTTVCRQSDLVTRQQGGRFVVAMPESGARQAREFISRYRRAISADPISIAGRSRDTTVSAGIAESSQGFIETQQQLIQRARTAVEQALQRGRSQTVIWRSLSHTEPLTEGSQRLTREGVSHWVTHLRQQIRSTCLESTRALVAAVEAKDAYTEAHSLTVAAYAEAIGTRMDMPAHVVESLRDAGLLHDVGKIGIPDAILTKPGPLTDDEFAVIKTHPAIALDIIRPISFLADERPFILHHHERFDGRGYPNGLAGRRIPIGARILAVVDALDTMLSPRAYKKPYSLEQAKGELIRNADKQFDPDVVNTTLCWLDESPKELARAEDRERRPVDALGSQTT